MLRNMKAAKEGRNTNGTFAKGNQLAVGSTNNGVPSYRLSGRHWIRRALEIPEDQWPKVPFCAADKNARKLVTELRKLKGRDFISSLATAHQDAYGQEARIEVAPSPDVEATNTRIAQIEAEIQRLLHGGK